MGCLRHYPLGRGGRGDSGLSEARCDARGNMRVIRGLLIAIAALGVIVGGYAWRSSFAPIDRPQASSFPVENVKAGAVLAAIGNCATCHTRDGGAAYAGGRPIVTPFGTIHATNITPDPSTGIGGWSEPSFIRAVREGVSRDGRHLYPAFPYDHMAKMAESDIKNVYAFLMTRRAQVSASPANELAFPFNIRSLVAGWKLFFLDRGGFTQDASKTVEWNRGAYLVEGLAHCGSCHTPRNVLGAEDKSRAYAGADVQGWTAPALGATSVAAVPWTGERLAEYLGKGRSPQHGVAAGPMADVIGNLAQVPDSDIKAMATYVASLAGAATKERQERGARAIARAGGEGAVTRPAAAAAPGASVYAGACAGCHGEAGRQPLDPALNLALSTTVRAASPNNLVRVVLGGIGRTDNQPGPHMPGFANALTDKQIGDLLEYVRANFTDRPVFAGLDVAIRKARQ